MRILAIIANLIMLAVIIYLWVDGIGDGELPLILLLVSTPILSILALLSSSGKGWLALWVKRKALEEQQKIDSMTKEK